MEYEGIKVQISEIVDFEIQTIRLLGSGMANTAYVINDSWVFRFAENESAKLTLQKEVKTLPVLRKSLPVRIPDPVYVRTLSDKPYFGGYRLLSGEPMTRERFDGLPLDVQQRLLQELHAFIIGLHMIEPDKVPELKEEPYAGAYNQSQRHFHTRLGSVISPEVVQKIEAVFVAYEADPAKSGGRTPIHSDLKPAHVLFDADAGHLSGILDWGDMALGDPDYDFVVVGIFFGADFLDRLLDCGNGSDKDRILRKVPFLTLVRALQDLMLYVTDHQESLVERALLNVESRLNKFGANGLVNR